MIRHDRASLASEILVFARPRGGLPTARGREVIDRQGHAHFEGDAAAEAAWTEVEGLWADWQRLGVPGTFLVFAHYSAALTDHPTRLAAFVRDHPAIQAAIAQGRLGTLTPAAARAAIAQATRTAFPPPPQEASHG